MRVIVATLGFEEKLVIRGLLSLGISGRDTLLVIYVRPLGDYERAKVRKALDYVRTMVGDTGVAIREVAVDARDLSDDLSRIMGALVGLKHVEEAIAVLTGGMRVLIPLAITALLSLHKYSGIRVGFLFMREDGLYFFKLSPEYFLLPSLSNREREVVAITARRAPIDRMRLVEAIASNLGVTQAMAYRWLESLRRKGIIEVSDSRVSLTPLGVTISILMGGWRG